MAWLNRVVARIDGSLKGRKFRISSTLYNLDASRSAAILDFGAIRGTYVREQERAPDGQYGDRHGGALIGPFTSPKEAETFILATPWFTGRDQAPGS